MANHKSAKKRTRQRIKQTDRNIGIRSRLKTAVRAFRDALKGDDANVTSAALETATRELRKAASKGVLPKRTASRRVSRLVLAQNSATK